MDFKWLPGKVGTPVIVQPPPPTPDAPPPPSISGVVVPPATNAGLRIFHTAWQLMGGVVCGILAKKFGYVSTPADVEKVAVAFTLVLATIKNVFVAMRASKAARPVVPTA